MDSFTFDIRVEKANAIKNHQRFQKISGLVWVGVVLVLLAKLSTSHSLSFKDIFINEIMFLTSYSSVFVIGNLIVITLVATFYSRSNCINRPPRDMYMSLAEQKQDNIAQEDDFDVVRSDDMIGPEPKLLVAENKSSRVERTMTCSLPNGALSSDEMGTTVTKDKLTNEEFRSTVEAFIERHKRFRRDEEFSSPLF